MLTWDTVEAGFEKFLELLRRDERVSKEFARSRSDFFVEGTGVRLPEAERRHLEWFLLEFSSPILGATPAFAWQQEWRSLLPAPAGELSSCFLQSLPGAFEVTSVVPTQVLWLRDLFTQAEHPVAPIQAARPTDVGDLVVGRIFPAGQGMFLASPAISVFRNPALLDAVRSDLARMRSVRRGVLRVQQLELERLFHGPGAGGGKRDTEGIRKRTYATLLAIGLPAATASAVLERVQKAARSGITGELTETLNELAFETSIDLSNARLALVELWQKELVAEHGLASGTGDLESSRALRAFDEGRAAGRDLEELFRELERQLGVENEEETEDPAEPVIPGVVAALVIEFLWEVERERGLDWARRWDGLRVLAQYGSDIGAFEELSETRLLDFGARWVLDEGKLGDSDLPTVLEALDAFCRWCEEHHGAPFGHEFFATLAGLKQSLPRFLGLRRHVQNGPGTGIHRVLRIDPTLALVRDQEGHEQEVRLTSQQARHLLPGDVVRLVEGRGGPSLGYSYPGDLRSLAFDTARKGGSFPE